MDKIKRMAIIVMGILLFGIVGLYAGVFFVSEDDGETNVRKEISMGEVVREEKQQKEEIEWGEIKEQIRKYREINMQFDIADYYNDGIWETMLDSDEKLFCSAKNDKTGRNMLISWNGTKQKEEEFLSENIFTKKKIEGKPSSLYYNGKNHGYIVYQKRKGKYECYLFGKKGKLIREISLHKFMKKKMDDTGNRISDIVQTGKNKISVIISKGYQSDAGYVMDINVKKNQLISIKEYNCWIEGVDSKYCYGIQIEKQKAFYPGHGLHFTCGQFVIIDRKTGTQVSSVEIPDDITSEHNRAVSQCFDIRNCMVWLANRTGIYYLRPGESEWTRIMNSEQSSYLNLKYTVVDITALNEDTFYLLVLVGEDDESANILVRYTAK